MGLEGKSPCLTQAYRTIPKLTPSHCYVCHASKGTENLMKAIVHGGWNDLIQILKQAL